MEGRDYKGGSVKWPHLFLLTVPCVCCAVTSFHLLYIIHELKYMWCERIFYTHHTHTHADSAVVELAILC